MSDVPKKKPGLIQRTLNKVLRLGEIAVHEAGKKVDAAQWWLNDLSLGEAPKFGAEAGNTIQMRELEHKLRRYQNIENNMFQRGIPETVPDVWPEPLSAEQSTRWNNYLKTQADLGVGRDEALRKLQAKQDKMQGYHTAIVPASDPVVSVHDLDPRDPYRDPRVLREFAKTPGSLGQDAAMMATGVYTPPTALWKQDNSDSFYEVPLPAKKQGPQQQQWTPPMREDLRRLDNTVKGPGFMGTVKNKEGYDMTELSVGLPGTEEGFYPLLGPWLTQDEVTTLQRGGKATPDMFRRARRAAEERERAGQPVFAPPGYSAGPVIAQPAKTGATANGKDRTRKKGGSSE